MAVVSTTAPRRGGFDERTGRRAGGRELLAALQQAARRPADVPHGLWLLLPVEDPRATPTLGGRTVEVVDRASEWEVLDSLFVKGLRARRCGPDGIGVHP